MFLTLYILRKISITMLIINVIAIKSMVQTEICTIEQNKNKVYWCQS